MSFFFLRMRQHHKISINGRKQNKQQDFVFLLVRKLKKEEIFGKYFQRGKFRDVKIKFRISIEKQFIIIFQLSRFIFFTAILIRDTFYLFHSSVGDISG